MNEAFKKCAVIGCNSNAHHSARGRGGYCAPHHYRLKRHGDALGGRTAPGAPMAFLRDQAFVFQGSECFIWPFARNGAGYGHLLVNGKNVLVHRLVCEHTNGQAPSGLHVAAHSCGNGHLGCCAPAHLRWATHAENQREKDVHGTLHKGETHYAAKLTERDVSAIRSDGRHHADIAKDFGVTPGNILAIMKRKSWRHVQ